jgi:hypothetical protein
MSLLAEIVRGAQPAAISASASRAVTARVQKAWLLHAKSKPVRARAFASDRVIRH